MLAQISARQDGDCSVVRLELPNGLVLEGVLDHRDQIKVVQNTTNLDQQTAECALGVAWLDITQDGTETAVWRRLVSRAVECQKKMESIRYRLN